MRFENEVTTAGGPLGITHKSQATMRSSYIEVERIFPVGKQETTGGEPEVSHYQSEIGDSINSLPKHVRRLEGNISQLTLPAYFDPTEPQDIITAMDGSVLFDVGYHSWLVSTKDEEIIVTGGGPYNGTPQHMPSCQSELGGFVQEWQ
jgi:hypothetical protein